MKKFISVLVLCSLASLSAFAQVTDEYVGEALVMEQGTSLTITTNLPCNQSTFTVPQFEEEYIALWSAVDSGEYQYAFYLLKSFSSRLSEAGFMLDDFKTFLAGQPGMPNDPFWYFQGKQEEVAGSVGQYLSPAWCLASYGFQFLSEEFGIGSPGTLREVKRYPRWETSGGQGLNVEFLPGKIKIVAPVWELNWPQPDYGDVLESEQVYYVPRKGAKPLLRFAISVVGDLASCKDAVSLQEVNGGYSVPLLEGVGSIIIPAQTQTAIRRKFASGSAPKQVPQYLRVPIGPDSPPSFEGQTEESQNPENGGLVLSSAYPKEGRKSIVAIPDNYRVEITERHTKWYVNDKFRGWLQTLALIKATPVKAEIDAEVGESVQMSADGTIGYYAYGPVVYDETKWIFYRTTYNWEAVLRDGRLVWKLRYYQLHQKIGMERTYYHNQGNGSSNRQVIPFIATITGWRSKAWVWVGWTIWHPFTKGHWEYQSVQWPLINGGYQMIIWRGVSSDNPDGIIDLEVMEPATPIYRN